LLQPLFSKRKDAARLDATLRAIRAVGFGFVLMQSSACSATQSAPSKETQYLCAVSGAEVLRPQMTIDAVCAAFKERIDAQLAQPSKAAAGVALTDADWIKLEIKFAKTGTAIARVKMKRSGIEVAHPEIAVDVMDRSLGPDHVAMLAKEVAKLVVGESDR
jgi:hypothetical protein